MKIEKKFHSFSNNKHMKKNYFLIMVLLIFFTPLLVFGFSSFAPLKHFTNNRCCSLPVITSSKTCIDCHMPLQVSKSLDFNKGTERKSIPYLLRTHRIAIDPEAE